MTTGRLVGLSIILSAVCVALATGAALLWQHVTGDRGWAAWIVFGAVAAATLLTALIPLAVSISRTMSGLHDYLVSIEGGATQHPVQGPRWMRRFTSAFTDAVASVLDRSRSLENQVRDLEIQYRVSCTERERVESVLSAMRDSVIVTNGFDEIELVNTAAERLLGLQAKDVLHRRIDEVVSDERLCDLVRDVREVANLRESRHVEHEVCVSESEHADGLVCELVLACVASHRNEVEAVVTILRDLTHDREIAQMKTDFVSKASHELRTPLSSIRAYLEMLIDGEAAEEASRQEFYGIMQSEANRLGRLIDNMLNISRIEAGIVKIERETIDCRQLVDRVIQTLEPQAREKSLTFYQKLAPVDLCVLGDSDMLYQVFLNLASNAVKYTPEGGRITFTIDTDNLTRSVHAAVTDTGLGLPPDAIEKVFEKFYRVENYKRVAKGTGLGLSLCKHIIETVHHGQIGVESKLGMGSRFWFSIPIGNEAGRAAA